MNSREIAIGLEKLQYGIYGTPLEIEEDDLNYYQKLEENFYWTFSIAWSPKDWPLMPLVSQYICELNEAGIQEYYEKIVRLLLCL